MTQAVDRTQASTTHGGARVPAADAQVSGADFGALLTLLNHPAGGIGPGPERIGNAVRSELKDPGRVELADIAAEEMTAASETPEHLNPKSSSGICSKPVSSEPPVPQPRPSATPTESGDRSAHAKPTSARPHDSSGPAAPPKNEGRASSRSGSAAIGATRPPPAVALAPSAKAAGATQTAASTGGGVRSVAAVGGGQPGGKDLLAKLTVRQNPPILRASKEELPAQVSRALARVVSEGGGKITLRLNPQALGEVRIDVDMHRGVARATLNAQTNAARDLLHSELDTLRTALERRGVSVERLEVVGPATDGSGASQEHGARGDGDHSAAANESNSHGRSAGRRRGSAEPESATGLQAEHGADATGRTPVRTDADGVVRVDAIA